MKKLVNSNLTGSIVLTDSDFVASGGQASIYKHNQYALKIYHDISTVPPVQKLKELQGLSIDEVLKPLDLILDSKGKTLGYIMRFVNDGWPMCKLFTKTFRTDKKISPKDIVELIKVFRQSLIEIHLDHCLVVDMNEFNLMTTQDFSKPIFLDVDSFQTPHFPATALMETVRDPLANNSFSEGSDWYSWAIIAFQLYIGMHPFKGNHPSYGRNEWRKRMDKGASVFDSGATLPQTCFDLNSIPKRHTEWFKKVFSNSERSIAPNLDASIPIPVVPRAARVICKNAIFSVSQIFKTDLPIVSVFPWGNTIWSVTQNCIWKNDGRMYTRGKEQVFVLFNSGYEVFAKFDGEKLRFSTTNGEFASTQVMFRENRMYSVFSGNLFEHTMSPMIQNSTIIGKRFVCQVCENQLKIYDGVAIQRTVDRTIVINPYDAGKAVIKLIPELDSYRIINAKAEGRVLVIIGEKKGMYHRLIIVFDKMFQNYTIRTVEDVATSEISFAVLANDVCVLATDDEVEIFQDNNTIRKVDNPPFDSTNKLFRTSNGLHFIDENIICKVSMK